MKLDKAILLLSACATIMCSCNEANKGEAMARCLEAAWPNHQAMQDLAADYNRMQDSLWIPGTASRLDNAFINYFEGQDSLSAMARAIALDANELGDFYGNEVANDLLNAQTDAIEASKTVSIATWALTALGRDAKVEQFQSAVDEVLKSYSTHDQMVIYSRSCSPRALAEALKEERQKADADIDDIDERVKMLEGIYTPEQLQEFKQNYINK